MYVYYYYVTIEMENKYTPCNPACPSPVLRSGVYLRGQDTGNVVIPAVLANGLSDWALKAYRVSLNYD